MSRPPNPVSVFTNAIAGGRSLPGRLQQLWSVLLEEGDEERAREPDDVQVVALDAFDEAAADTLDCISPGASLPLPAPEIALDRFSREQAEGDLRPLVRQDLVVAREEAQARDDGVRPAGELPQ